ncbi:MAG: PaaI family thioesterase [Vicinamibacterales bacterium]
MSTTRVRTVTWDDPAVTAPAFTAGPGLEVLRRSLAGAFPPSPMAQLMGLELVDAAPGTAVFAADPGEHLYNPSGVVHGGFAATILDSAVGCAVYTTVEGGDTYTTIELKVNYVKAITTATGRVRATGRVLHRGRRTVVAEGRLEDASGRLLAHATTTCLVIPA